MCLQDVRRHHNLQDVRTVLLQYHANPVGHSWGTATTPGNLTGQCHITNYAQCGRMTRPDVPHAIEDIICLLLAIEP
jgi:hypothetical protein